MGLFDTTMSTWYVGRHRGLRTGIERRVLGRDSIFWFIGASAFVQFAKTCRNLLL